MRVDVDDTVLYFHFYNNNGRIQMKTPHVEGFDCRVNEPTIRKYVKYDILDAELIRKLGSKMDRLVEDLEEDYNCKFSVVEE